MQRIRNAVAAALVASALSLQPAPATAQDRHGAGRHGDKHSDKNKHDRRSVPRAWRNYDYRNYEPGQRRYDASRYYWSDNSRYQPRRLGRNDRIYRGSDNRYYCRRDDGTTGLIVGGLAGGVLGHIIAPEGSKTLGAIIGAGGGALIGRAIDDGVECR